MAELTAKDILEAWRQEKTPSFESLKARTEIIESLQDKQREQKRESVQRQRARQFDDFSEAQLRAQGLQMVGGKVIPLADKVKTATQVTPSLSRRAPTVSQTDPFQSAIRPPEKPGLRQRAFEFITREPESLPGKFFRSATAPLIAPYIAAASKEGKTLRQQESIAEARSKLATAGLIATTLTPIPGDEAIAASIFAKVGVGTLKVAKATTVTTGAGRFGIGTFIEGSKATASKEQKKVIQTPGFKDIMGKGIAAELQDIGIKTQVKTKEGDTFMQRGTKRGKGLAMAIAGDIEPLRLIGSVGSKEAFKTETTELFKAQGYKGKDLDIAVSAALRQRTARAAGAGVGLVGANVGSELFGQRFVSESLKGTKTILKQGLSWELFKKTAPAIGKAGIAEGVASVAVTDVARERETSLKRLAIGGAFGGLSAGLIGGGIAMGSGAASKLGKAAGKALHGAALIADPFEIFGDVGAKGLQKTSSRLAVAVPTIIPSIEEPRVTITTDPNSIIRGTTQGKAKAPSSFDKPPRKGVPTIAENMAFMASPPKGKTPSQILDDAVSHGGKGGSTTFTDPTVPTPPGLVTIPKDVIKEKVLMPGKTPAFPDVNIPTFPDVFIPVPPPEITKETIPVTPSTNIPTFPLSINIPTVVPLMHIPPPLPLAFPTGGRRGGLDLGFGKKFINELSVGQQALQSFAKFDASTIMGTISVPRRKAKTPKSKGKKKKKKSQSRQTRPVFDPMAIVFGV